MPSKFRGRRSLCRLPYLIQNPCSKGGLVLRQEAAVVVGDHLGRVLDRIACLLVGAGLFQNMGGKTSRTLCGPWGSSPLMAPRPV